MPPVTSQEIAAQSLDRATTYTRATVGKRKGAVPVAFRDFLTLVKNHRDAAILIAVFLAIVAGAAVDRYRRSRPGLALGLITTAQDALTHVIVDPSAAEHYTAGKAFKLLNPPAFQEDADEIISELRRENTVLQKQIAALTTGGNDGNPPGAAAAKIAQLEAEVTELEIANDNLVNQMNAQTGQLHTANATITSLTTQNNDLVQLNTALNAANAALLAQIEELENGGAMAALQADLDAAILLNASRAEQIETLTAEKNNLEVTVDQLENERLIAEGSLATAQAEVANLATSLSSAQNEVVHLMGQINSLPNTSHLETENANLRSAIAALESERTGYQTNLGNLQLQIAGLDATISSLSSANQGYLDQVNTLQAQLGSLPATVAQLQADLASLQTHASMLDANISNLHQTIAAKDQEIGELQAQIAALQP